MFYKFYTYIYIYMSLFLNTPSFLNFPPFFERKKPKEPWQNMFDPKFQWKGPHTSEWSWKTALGRWVDWWIFGKGTMQGLDISSPVLLDIEVVRHESYFGGLGIFFV